MLPSEPRARPLSLAIGGMVAMAVGLGIGRFVYTPILPFMIDDIGMSAGSAGLVASANYVGYLVGALLAATPYMTGSRRTWLLIALVASALSTGAMGAIDTFVAMVALRFVGGVASALMLIFASTLVLERLRVSGREGFSALHFGGVGMGIAMSAVLVTALAHAGFHWRALWYACGGLSLIGVALVAWLVPDQPEPAPAPPAKSGSGGLALIGVAYGLFGFGYVITATFIVLITRSSAEIKNLEPVIWLVVGLVSVPSVAVWNLLSRRVGSAVAFGLACFAEASGIGASAIWPGAVGVLLAAVMLGATFAPITTLGLAYARQIARGNPSQIVAAMTVAFITGQIIGPSFGGLLFQQTGSFRPPTLVAAAALILAAALAWRASRSTGAKSGAVI